MKILLFDGPFRKNLFPLTLTRAVADLRIGILTIKEKWERLSKLEVETHSDDCLLNENGDFIAGEYLIVDASVKVEKSLYERLLGLASSEAIADEVGLIGGRVTLTEGYSIYAHPSTFFTSIHLTEKVLRLEFPHQIINWNGGAILDDFQQMFSGRTLNRELKTCQLINESQIFIEEGANVNFAILNATDGPIYIGRNALVMEGCLIRGPSAMCENSVLKMGSKIYGGTTLGRFSVGGGEVKNSVIMDFSNKGHEGFLGDSIIGQWCNLGAGTSNSNVKNTGGTVKVWNYSARQFLPSGNKCGVIMGDYSRTAINTSLNTGAVVGVCCNVFGEGLAPRFIPDFSWGTKPVKRYNFEKAIRDIDNWKKMKNKTLGEQETKVLKHIFDLSDPENL